MNILIVDDISTVGNAIKSTLSAFTTNHQVHFYKYDVDKNCNENIGYISEIGQRQGINFLALDRGYSKVFEGDNNFLYSSNTESDHDKKQTADTLLCGDPELGIVGLLEILKQQNYSLSRLLVYTYDPFDLQIERKLVDLKNQISRVANIEAENVIVIETSSIFNKPSNSELYPNNFNAHPNIIERKIFKRKRKLGLKSTFEEYGFLIGSVVKDIYNETNDNIYSFLYRNNLILDKYVKLINGLIVKEKTVASDFSIGAISFLAKITGSETYLIDIPYKEYYEPLNKSIIDEGLISLFKNSDGEYFPRREIYYSYNYNSLTRQFELYKLITDDTAIEMAKKWLPYLHSGIFHDSESWKVKDVTTKPEISGSRINIFFFYQKVTFDDFKGHINYTFYNESNNSISEGDLKKCYDEIYSFRYPLIKAKAAEVLIPELKVFIQRQAIKAAISQVNARTTSHNTGSHILSNDIEEFDVTSNEYLLKQKEQLQEFRYYLRQRMLYNADLASESTKAYSSTDLMTVLKSFENLIIVKKYISGVKDKTFYEFIEKSKIKNCNVSIPNDVLGFQALYIVFENLIRNFFKHGGGTGKLFNEKTGKLNLKIQENSTFNTLFYRCFEITDGSIINQEQYNRIKALIREPILENNVLRKEGLGYLEIKAALSYLNDLPLDNIDSPYIDEANSMQVFSVQDITSDSTLRYRFYLKKPFFLKISNSNQLDYQLLEKGIVDSKAPTEFDKYCGFYCSESNVPNNTAGITLRVMNESIAFSNSDSLDSITYNLYEKWLRKISAPESIICLMEGVYSQSKPNPSVTYKQIHKNESSNGYTYAAVETEAANIFSKYPIFFDDHSRRIEYIIQLSKSKKQHFFYEDFKGLGNTGKIITGFSSQKKSYFVEQLTEAAHAHVIIIDERIQRHADRMYREVNSNFNSLIYEQDVKEGDSPQNEKNSELKKLSTREVLEWMNIYVPHKDELNLNTEKFVVEEFKNNAKDYIAQRQKAQGINIVVIHLGIIEKLTVDKSPKTISSIIQDIVGNEFDKSKVVITSERGTPDNLESFFRFLHFSNISKHIIEDKSKLGLVTALLNSRSLTINN